MPACRQAGNAHDLRFRVSWPFTVAGISFLSSLGGEYRKPQPTNTINAGGFVLLLNA
jgi:hypothetical protein